MTVAVCLECGEIKHGAFTRCRACGFTPKDDESLTKHLLLTDHYLSIDEIHSIAARIKSGEEIHFDPQTLAENRVDSVKLEIGQRNCLIGCVSVLLNFVVHPSHLADTFLTTNTIVLVLPRRNPLSPIGQIP